MIISLSGKLGSGKSFITKHIKNTFKEYNFERKSFGYNLKKVTSFLTGVSMKTILSRKAKELYLPEWNMTIGQMFQKLGTDAIRNNLHQNAWVISLFSDYTEDKNYIIDDVRFITEADAIKKRNGIIIRLEGDPANLRNKDTRNHNHSSETELDNYENFDIVWQNEVSEKRLNDLMKIIEDKIKSK